jgi:hypothetical protein
VNLENEFTEKNKQKIWPRSPVSNTNSKER